MRRGTTEIILQIEFEVKSHRITLPSCLAGLTVNSFECRLLLFQAWLTEIHEYAQSDVVIMLLGNKVRGFFNVGVRGVKGDS